MNNNNSFAGLPPGSILQLLHIERRLKKITPGTFIEVGPGAGDVTAVLLSLGWVGHVYDLHKPTIEKLEKKFKKEISDSKLTLHLGDFIGSDQVIDNSDLFISCMVLEHIPKHLVAPFFDKVHQQLKENGLAITIVPGSPSHWGIEDDIAGHVERYTFCSLEDEVRELGFSQKYISGLTFPLSNMFLPLSNHLVKKAEKNKISLKLKARTALSGDRNVKYKTHYPKFINIVLNRWVMRPFDLLQRIFSKSPSSLVIYQESQKVSNEK